MDRVASCLPLPGPLLETWPGIQACALTGNQIGSDLSIHRLGLNPLTHTSQGKVTCNLKCSGRHV